MTNDSIKLTREFEGFVYKQMELFAKNPSNSNKYFNNLLAGLESQLTLPKREVLTTIGKWEKGE